eukprot:5465538-Amphidinium_carterae.1
MQSELSNARVREEVKRADGLRLSTEQSSCWLATEACMPLARVCCTSSSHQRQSELLFPRQNLSCG